MYDFKTLIPFVQRQIHSGDDELAKLASDLLPILEEPAEVTEEASQDVSPPKNEMPDQIMQVAMPELDKKPIHDRSPFGKRVAIKLPPESTYSITKSSSLWSKLKHASAYIDDVPIKDLPQDVQDEVLRFVNTKDNPKVARYGMVVKELLPKVDDHNFATALAHVKDNKTDKDKFYKTAKTKYILLVNDKIVDGHHFLARAKELGVTMSLNVLDLTPARFQKASAWQKLKHRYVSCNHSR